MGGYYELAVTSSFSSAHSLEGYEGNCERVHGHNWKVDLIVSCSTLDDRGIGIDFRELKGALNEVVDSLDHRNLNDIEPFHSVNPSSENIAFYIFSQLKKRLPEDVKVKRVRVWESDTASASYVRE